MLVETRLLAATPSGVAEAAALLQGGGLVAMPTETVYGLAADALNAQAVAKVFEAKGRPAFDPLIVHVAQADACWERLAARGLIAPSWGGPQVKALAERLMAALWPGPLTLVLRRGERVPDLVTSGLESVAIRCPAHPVAQALLRESGLALAAPSANRFGRISPTTAAHVMAELAGRLDAVLDGGPCAVGVESTIIAVADDGQLWLLRPGGVSLAQVEAAAQAPVLDGRAAAGEEPSRPQAPGMLLSHYAPRKPLYRLDTAAMETPDAGLPRGEVGLLLRADEDVEPLRARYRALGLAAPQVEALGPRGDWSEAARRLFSALRSLDGGDAPTLWVEAMQAPGGGATLADAVLDRLRRASQSAP
jgi:L-threonylcarbamoyladenylate synthase